MALFDDLTKKAAKLTEQTIDKSQELASITKTKLKIKNLGSDRDDLFRDLGKYYFHLIEQEDSVDETVADIRMKIYDLDQRIKELEELLQK